MASVRDCTSPRTVQNFGYGNTKQMAKEEPTVASVLSGIRVFLALTRITHWSCDLQRWYCTISRFSVCHLRELAGPALYDIFIRRTKNTSDNTTFYRLESNKAKNLVKRKSDISTNEPSTPPSCLRTPSHAINQETSRITFPPYISTYHCS